MKYEGKQQLFRADGGGNYLFAKPANSVQFTEADKEGLQAVKLVSITLKSNYKYLLDGYDKLNTSQKKAFESVWRRALALFDNNFKSVGSSITGLIGKSYLQLKGRYNDNMSYVVYLRNALVSLYDIMMLGAPACNTDEDKENGGRWLVEYVPQYSPKCVTCYYPYDEEAYNARVEQETEQQQAKAEADKATAEAQTEQASADLAAAQADLAEQEAKSKSTANTIIKWAAVGILAAAVIFVIVKLIKKK